MPPDRLIKSYDFQLGENPFCNVSMPWQREPANFSDLSARKKKKHNILSGRKQAQSKAFFLGV
jgi:hypothetical protein